MKLHACSSLLLHLATFLLLTNQSIAGEPHLIRFRSTESHPSGLAYDHFAEHFIVGSLHRPILSSVSDAGVSDTLIHDTSLPPNSSFIGIAFDRSRRRILVLVQSAPNYSALAAYDQASLHRVFLSNLPSEPGSNPTASAIAGDPKGNYYVTNSDGNFIWKVSDNGRESAVWSKSPLFNKHPPSERASCGLSGVVYVNLGYLLVVQSSTGKLFKVDLDGGAAREVVINKNLGGARGLALRSDGVVLVVSGRKVWFVKSSDSWGEATVYDESLLEKEELATAIVVGRERKAYVAYGGTPMRDWFEIGEVRSAAEGEDEKVWIYVVIGLGLAYFLFWRFQMRRLVGGLDKKVN